MKGEKYTIIKLKSNYHQGHANPRDVWNTAFEAKDDLYEWLVIIPLTKPMLMHHSATFHS
jgi:hypothetical protein